MAFDDGTPLDAAALQNLETELIKLKSNVPKVGSSTVINLNNSLPSAATQKQILGGVSGVVSLTKGVEKEFSISYNADSTPIAIILTPVKWSGDFKKGDVSYYIMGNTVTSTSASGKAFLSTTATSSFSIKFYFMVVCA